ncbi:MAG: hypothetical protein IJZ75_05340 [Clostridia bacterium]|nr:hypothetical protein [Clostridia bacterium]
MKKVSNIIWGVLLIIAGVFFAIDALDIAEIDILFDGWWTLFIIVPCFAGLFTEREKTGNIIGLALGVLLLLCCQDILSFSMLWKFLIPVIIIRIGLKLIIKAFSKKTDKQMVKLDQGSNTTSAYAIFSGKDLNFSGQTFEGAKLTTVFGGIMCDLRGANIEKDCVIKTFTAFGGLEIIVPENVNVVDNTECIFGGVSNTTVSATDTPTVYISGPCVFGGIDIRNNMP